MPKLRLNKSYRALLQSHARKFVESLPLSPEDTKELREAEQRRDAVSAALIAKARTFVAARLPEVDMDVLRRYDATFKTGDARFMVETNHDLVFVVSFYDDLYGCRGYYDLTYDEQRALGKKREMEEAEARIEVPRWGRHGNMILCDQELYDMHKDFELAKREETHARKTLDERQCGLRRSLETLIETAKYYEDVVAVWPAAAEVRAELGGPQQALTVLSQDAIDEIGEAMKLHQKQLTAAAKHKALPAPESAPEIVPDAAMVIDAEIAEAVAEETEETEEPEEGQAAA